MVFTNSEIASLYAGVMRKLRPTVYYDVVTRPRGLCLRMLREETQGFVTNALVRRRSTDGEPTNARGDRYGMDEEEQTLSDMTLEIARARDGRHDAALVGRRGRILCRRHGDRIGVAPFDGFSAGMLFRATGRARVGRRKCGQRQVA